MSNERRKFYQDDLSKYFLVEYLHKSLVDPEIASALEKYDIKTDPEYDDDSNERRIELHSHYLDHGCIDDRRIYAALISPERGYGAFADVYIPPWTIIGEYTGVITNKKFNTDYAWNYYSEPLDASGNKMSLRTDARMRGNMLRFVNHSDDPNCSVIHIPYQNRWRTLYISNTGLLPDQELTIFYGKNYWKERKKD